MTSKKLTPAEIEQYGLKEQQNIASLSDVIFKSFDSRDSSDIIKMLQDITKYLDRINSERDKKKRTLFLFKKSDTTIIRQEYSAVRQKIQLVSEKLKDYKIRLLKNAKMYEQYDMMNRSYTEEIQKKIINGKEILDSYDEGSCDIMLVRMETLHTSLHVARQLSAQINLMRTQDKILLSDIQDILMNTIAVWQNQIMIILERNKGIEELEQKNNILKDRFNLAIKDFQKIKDRNE